MTEMTIEESKRIREEIETKWAAWRRKALPTHEEKIADAVEKWKINIVQEMIAGAERGSFQHIIEITPSKSLSVSDYKEVRMKLENYFKDIFVIKYSPPQINNNSLYWTVTLIEAND